MTVVTLLRALTRAGGAADCPRCRRAVTVVVECRHCGTTLEGPADACPACDAADVVRYEIR